MKRLIHVLMLVAVMAMILAVPTAVDAAAWTISQTPDTTGAVFEGGSSLSVTWECSPDIPEDAMVTLWLAQPFDSGFVADAVDTGLALSQGYEVIIPTDGGPYFYYIEADWWYEGEFYDAYSDAYWAWLNGTPWWFTIGTSPSITLQPLSQTAVPGDLVVFDADADGSPDPTVQWQVDTGSGWTDIAGADTESCMVDVTSGMDGWQYRAVFTNDIGEATTDPAVLTVESVTVPVYISDPTWFSGTGKLKRLCTFQATVYPIEAAGAVEFTLHLLHWETQRVDGVRVAGWYEYPDLILLVADPATGTVAGTMNLPKRGDWKMYVTSTASDDYLAGSSSEVLFTLK